MARRFCLIIAVLILGSFTERVWAAAETFHLVGGESVLGELLVASANDAGVQIKISEGEYKRVPWANFSQDDLKRISKIPKLAPLVEPFIEITQEEKIKKTEVTIKPWTKLELPPSHSLFGAMFSSGLGVLIILVLYAANIYAGYEISIFRAQPVALVCGVAAILPIIGPIIFLSMPTKIPARAESWEPAPAAAEPASPTGAPGAGAQPGGLRVAGAAPAAVEQGETGEAQPVAAEPAQPALPASTSFKRGQFTFNRRFFETKFPGFFGVVRRDADRDMVLLIKSARGQYIGQRISRIAANDLHLQVEQGGASQEVMIPFQDIQEITLKHKDA